MEPEAADRSLAGGLWPGQPDINPDRVLVADLDGDGVAERIVVLNAEDRDENMGAPLRSALAVVAGDGSPVFSGWPSVPDREDLWDAGVPKASRCWPPARTTERDAGLGDGIAAAW